MARPREKGLKYFPHDCDLDDNVEILVSTYGNDGYAFYFRCLERIYKSDNAALNIKNVAIKKDLMRRIGVREKKFDKMLETALELDSSLFSVQLLRKKGLLTSSGIQRRAGVVFRHRDRNKSKVLKTVSAAETPQGITQKPRQKKRSNPATMPERRERVKEKRREEEGQTPAEGISMKKANEAWTLFEATFNDTSPGNGFSINDKLTRNVIFSIFGKATSHAAIKQRMDQNGGNLEHEFKERYKAMELTDFKQKQ